jgi:hypothetical protein
MRAIKSDAGLDAVRGELCTWKRVTNCEVLASFSLDVYGRCVGIWALVVTVFVERAPINHDVGY